MFSDTLEKVLEAFEHLQLFVVRENSQAVLANVVDLQLLFKLLPVEKYLVNACRTRF